MGNGNLTRSDSKSLREEISGIQGCLGQETPLSIEPHVHGFFRLRAYSAVCCITKSLGMTPNCLLVNLDSLERCVRMALIRIIRTRPGLSFPGQFGGHVTAYCQLVAWWF